MIKITDFFLISNLLSIFRILIAPFIVFFLQSDTLENTLLALLLIVTASISDGLDGFLARRFNQVSRLGVALDPIADKIFAAVLVIGLILYRDFPVWLALVIVGRDIIILFAGMILLRGREITLPSNLTGKYAFTIIAILLTSYVIEFRFGIRTCTILTIIFIILSLLNYAKVFISIKKTGSPPVFIDRSLYKNLRLAGIMIYSTIFLYYFYIQIIK